MNSKIQVTQGAGTNLATAEITESAEQRHLSRVVPQTSAGADIDFAKDGTDITSPVAMPAGGVGIRGWLSAIWTKLNGTVAVTGAGDATSANQTTQISKLTSLDTKIPSQGQALAASSMPVVLPAAQISALTPPAAITGFNLEATQSALNSKFPSAASLSDATTNPNTHIAGSALMGWNGTTWDRLKTDGTNNDSDPVESVGILSVEAHNQYFNGTSWDRVRGTIANGALVDVSRLPSLPTGANTIGAISNTSFTATQATPANLQVTATQLSITKGTQGTTGVSCQDLKDAGRSSKSIFLDSFAVAATAETLNTMSYSSDNGTATTGTSYNVTAGKRFRLQSIVASLHTITGNTTAVNVIVRMRVNNGGAAIVSSPIQFIIPIAGVALANGASQSVIIPIPDGYEFVAGAGIGITTTCAGFVTTTAAPKVDISITGYEY